ncbi:hypothetical protein I7I48_07538 [Histoplasma ohiense]|nr:hypothetical protein I7I48_07538 [Histoplasma ohiense (nom. inval.)]
MACIWPEIEIWIGWPGNISKRSLLEFNFSFPYRVHRTLKDSCRSNRSLLRSSSVSCFHSDGLFQVSLCVSSHRRCSTVGSPAPSILASQTLNRQV